VLVSLRKTFCDTHLTRGPSIVSVRFAPVSDSRPPITSLRTGGSTLDNYQTSFNVSLPGSQADAQDESGHDSEDDSRDSNRSDVGKTGSRDSMFDGNGQVKNESLPVFSEDAAHVV
jgi:hypothetical protein